jgi:hypothetical protein
LKNGRGEGEKEKERHKEEEYITKGRGEIERAIQGEREGGL